MNVDAFLTGLARSSIQAGVLVLLVLLTQRIFRRQLTARGRCLLWGVVMVRLLIPASPHSTLSVFNLLPSWDSRSSSTLPASVEEGQRQAAAVLDSTTTGDPDAAPAAMPRRQAEEQFERGRFSVTPGAGPIPADGQVDELAAVSTASAVDASAIRQDVLAMPASSIRRFGLSLSSVLFLAWLLGVGVLGTVVAIRSGRVARQCRRHHVVEDFAVNALLQDCQQRLGLSGRLVVQESAAVTTPAVLGPLRPRLLLPEGFLGRFGEQGLRYVFLHELAHVRRRDLWLNWLVTILQLMHWFNPLIWLGFARWRSDREAACDALALEAAGGDHSRDYGQTILQLLEGCEARSLAPGLIGILEDPRQLRRRIEQIARFRPGQRIGFLALGAGALLAVVGLTDAQSPKPRDLPVAVAAPAEPRPVQNLGPPNRTNDSTGVWVGADPDTALSATNAEARRVMIRVFDPAGQPVPGAKIESLGNYLQSPKRLTDSNGAFLLRYELPPDMNGRFVSGLYAIQSHHEKFPSRGILVPMNRDPGGSEALTTNEATFRFQPGILVGGVVLDSQGRPLPDIRVLLAGSIDRPQQRDPLTDYPSIVLMDPEAPAARTDDQGRWWTDRVSADVGFIRVTFVWPDGGRELFDTRVLPNGLPETLIALADLKNLTATNRLSDGLTVHGRVVDEQGKPIPGATVRDGYGRSSFRISECTTDNQGRFERGHRAFRQWIFTASAPGRATASVVAQVEPGMPEVRIVLPPERPWRARTFDAEGRPLAGVRFRVDSRRTEAQILDWTGKSDAKGLVVWTNAPKTPVMLQATADGLDVTTRVKIRSMPPRLSLEGMLGTTIDFHETVVLNPRTASEIQVRIEVMEFPQRPVPIRSLSVQFNGEAAPLAPLAHELSTNAVTVSISRTNFQFGLDATYRLLVELEDCMAISSEFMDFDTGDQRMQLVINRAVQSGEITILTPEGKPAAGARLWGASRLSGGQLFIHGSASRVRYTERSMKEQLADDRGQVCLPAGTPEAPIVIVHEDGFLAVPRDASIKSRTVRLESYGRVEGQLIVVGAPAADTGILLEPLTYSDASGVSFAQRDRTDSEGRFVMDGIPPGEYKISREGLPRQAHPLANATQLQQMPVTVRAGETLRIKYASRGRQLVGQLVPSRPDAEVTWQTDLHTLSLKVPPPMPGQHLNYEDYATKDAFEKANRSFDSNARHSRLERTYALDIDPDGTFRIEDVAPGTYELRVAVAMPKRDGETFADLEKLTREIVVPEGDGPLELGMLTLPIRDPNQDAKR